MKSLLLSVAAASVLASASPALAATTDLEGTWDVQRSQRDGLAELDITRNGTSYTVRAALACSPRVCDLGQTNGWGVLPLGKRDVARDTSGLTAGFDGKDASRQIIAQVAGRDRLSVTLIQSYKDGRPAQISTETFVRADDDRAGSGGGVEPDCQQVSQNLRIRSDGRAWTLNSGGTTLATFDSPDAAGYARYLIQSHGLSQKCTLEDSDFEYWTLSGGAFPKDSKAGEYCSDIDPRSLQVRGRGNRYTVVSAGQTLYEVQDEDVADAIVDILQEKGARSQCVVGDRGRGITYFRR